MRWRASGIILMMIWLQPSNGDLVQSRFLLEPGEEFDLMHYVIWKTAEAFPLEAFIDDGQLIQRVDRANKMSEYRNLVRRQLGGTSSSGSSEKGSKEEEEGEVVFQRKSKDFGEVVVFLRGNEDKVKVFGRKRVFVVLRQHPKSRNGSYFVNYAYLRYATNSEKAICGQTYLRERLCFEWGEPWDGIRTEVKAPYKYIGWGDCLSSFFTTCRRHSKTEGNVEDNVLDSEDKTSVADLIEGIGPLNKNAPLEIPYLLPLEYDYPGLDGSTNFELFWDLDNNRQEGYHVRELIKENSVIDSPESAGLLVPKDGKLSGFNSGGVEREPCLVSIMEHATEHYVEKYEGKSHEDHANATESPYDKMKGLVKERAALVQETRELHEFIHNQARWLGFGEYVQLKDDSDNLTAFQETLAVKTNLERLEERETRLKEIDKESRILEREKQSKVVFLSMSDVFQNPGWKFAEFAHDKSRFKLGASTWKEGVEFYGFGTCEYKPLSSKEIRKVEEFKRGDEDLSEADKKNATVRLVDFYLRVLRLQCTPESKHYLIYLVDQGYLEVEGMTFDIPENLTVLGKPKLSVAELRMLAASLEFSVFTQVYVSFRGRASPPLLPISNISRTVDFVTRFSAAFVKSARTHADAHFVKMTRNLLITLKGIMTRLIQDQEILDVHCKGKIEGKSKSDGCKQVYHKNHQEKLAVNSAIQWVVHGLAILEMSRNMNTKEMLQRFYRDNKVSIELGLTFYEFE